ncbi:carboxypeptidase [Plakobranchus ocellatus]|uniref:Carboxypeptidase n=1 Tax=Plakobranchus ocellatus TaxID=259542 RepID=A0AAV3Z178_9GAST|nr:carboxypeptidase [Plakobranchus ocellatus]
MRQQGKTALVAASAFAAVFSIATLSRYIGRKQHPANRNLTPYIANGEIKEAQKLSLVTNSSTCSQNLRGEDVCFPLSYAGFITVDEKLGNNLFFWYFPSQEDPGAPLAIWLNGGPGVSSMFGLFWDNGPLQPAQTTEDNAKNADSKSSNIRLERRKDSWVGPLSMVYVDNPVGVGYSYSTSGDLGVHSTHRQITDDLYEFLQQFYMLFPENKRRDLYIGGQSYAGKYVPFLAHRIHEAKKKKETSIPLTGIYMGGPFFAPEKMLIDQSNYLFNVGAISLAQLKKQRRDYRYLVDKYVRGEYFPLSVWDEASRFFHNFPFTNNFVTSEYPDEEAIHDIMTSELVQNAIGVGNVTYKVVSWTVRQKLGSTQFFASARRELGELLDSGSYKVLIYNGDYDVLVNSEMIDEALLVTRWAGRSEFANASRKVWTRQRSPVSPREYMGFYSHTGNLCRVVVHGAGHQVGHDQAEISKLMISSFVKDGCIKEGTE